MAEQQNILIKILADVAGANASFGKLQKTLGDLSNGTITLSKNFNAFEKGVSGSIGAQKAAEQVSKQYLQVMRQRLNISRAEVAGIKAVTEMHKAEAAAINAKIALQKAELAGDSVLLREMQQELQLRRLAVQEIELENRERRALTATKKNSAKATGQVTEEVQRSTGAMGSASFALLSFGQGLQDSAQFGMGAAQGLRAVNNNIQQFVTALALGSEQAGGMKNLLRDMRSLLIGPAGVIVAFSLVSAALEFFTTRAQRAKKEGEDFARAWEEAANSVFSFEDALSGMTISVPEQAITPLRERLEQDIKAIDDLISDAEESLSTEFSGSFSLALANAAAIDPIMGNIAQGSDDVRENTFKSAESDAKILEAREAVANLDMDRIEGQRRLLALLKQQEGFLDKRNELISLAKNLGLDFESTSKRTLTTIEKLTNQYDDLVKAFAGTGEAERQEGALRARIAVLENLRDITIEYSQSIEEMRLLMSQEGQEVISETERLEGLNKELRERIRLRRQVLGLEKVGADQLVQLSDSTKDFADEYARQNAERIKADAEGAKSFLNLQEGISKGIGLVSRSFGSMGTTFMQLAQQQEDGSRRMFKIGKALAISQAIMNSYQAYTAALADQTMPGPLRFISAGAALAAGLAQVAAIKSTKFGGGGGSSGSSSGRGGISSAPTFFTSFGNISDFPASNVASLSAASTSGTNISLVVQGRNLVGVIENEMQASSRRIGYSTGVFSGALASSSSTRDVFGGIK